MSVTHQITDHIPVPGPESRWRPQTFSASWAAAVSANPAGVFLVYEHDDEVTRQWTYEEFDDVVGRAVAALVGLGVGAGDVVHMALGNCPTFVAVWLAANQLGAAIAPSDPRSTERELAVHLAKVRPSLGICGLGNETAYRAAAPRGMMTVASAEGPDIDPELQVVAGGPAELRSPQPADTAAIMFTSGTTSAPKGVVVTQGNYAFAGEVMSAAACLSTSDRYLVVLPLFHANAQYYCFAAAICTGASVALMPRFSASRLLSQAVRHRVTHVSLFAAPIRMLLARGAVPVDGLRVRNVWYAQRLTSHEYEQASALFGCRLREIYGMTETIAAVLASSHTQRFTEAVGRVTLGCSVTLLPQRDSEGGGGTEDGIGEIAVAGRPGLELFAGYLDDPEATARAWDGAWFRSGDLGQLDQTGSVVFHGRRGDVLKVAGENVSVLEVEAVLAEYPGVAEVAVVGESDDVRDEVPVAYVVCRPDVAITEKDLVAYAALYLAPAKQPRRAYFVDSLPRTAVGKIRRFLLRPPT